MGNSDRRAQTVIATLEVLLKETLASAELYREKERTATNGIDRQSAASSRVWCEGNANAYQNSIDQLREEFGEGGEDDHGE